jgi:hypothetical protein
MHPFIRDGDVITVSPLGEGSPGLGDVVAFVQREIERLVVHRVIRIEANSYFMKGDDATGVDGPVPTANILGLVTRARRGQKRVFIGLGPERFLIALLARKGLMAPLVRVVAKLLRPIRYMVRALFLPFQGPGSSRGSGIGWLGRRIFNDLLKPCETSQRNGIMHPARCEGDRNWRRSWYGEGQLLSSRLREWIAALFARI